jgi:hypothetical protein
MYTFELGDPIASVTEFVESFETNQEFLLAAAKAMSIIPVDCFQYIKYMYSHVALGRIRFLQAKKKENLIPYSILWDIAKIFSDFSLIEVTRQEAYEELLKLFELKELTQAEFTPILTFDSGGYGVTAIDFMKSSTEEFGFYQVKFLLVYRIFKEYLI